MAAWRDPSQPSKWAEGWPTVGALASFRGAERNIDDLSEFSINQCYGPGEKLDLGGVDEVVSLAAAWMRVGGQAGDTVRVQLSTGMVLEAPKAEEFKNTHGIEWAMS